MEHKMNKESFKSKLGSWYQYFEPFLESKELYNIYQKLQKDSNNGKIIFPYSENTFKAFELCNKDNFKLLLLGSEPYPGRYYDNKLPHSTGLSFDNSNCSKNKLQPSLEYFWEGIAEEYQEDKKLYETKDLTFLAKQGVLLGNRSLTVEEGIISSHKGLWDSFWQYFLETILPSYFQGVQILFLGKDAFKLKSYVFNMTNPIHYLEHPSAAARGGQLWNTSNIFHKINKYIELNNRKEYIINWKYNV